MLEIRTRHFITIWAKEFHRHHALLRGGFFPVSIMSWRKRIPVATQMNLTKL